MNQPGRPPHSPTEVCAEREPLMTLSAVKAVFSQMLRSCLQIHYQLSEFLILITEGELPKLQRLAHLTAGQVIRDNKEKIACAR